jgi:hypothetical protein
MESFGWIFSLSPYFCLEKRLEWAGAFFWRAGVSQMPEVKDRPAKPKASAPAMVTPQVSEPLENKTFSLNGKFIRNEAKDAVRSFVAPYAGLYGAVTGKRMIFRRPARPGAPKKAKSL